MCIKMATKFKISGYAGLNKVAMTKAFKEDSGLNLKESKIMTDNLLENGVLEFEVDDNKKAEKLFISLKSANANVSKSK